MKLLLTIKNYALALICICFPLSILAEETGNHVSQALTYYCANQNLEFQESVQIDPATRVSLLQDAFMQVESQDKLPPDANLIKQQLLQAGIGDKCAEYLLTQGKVKKEGPLARVYFDFDKSVLTDESKYVLDTLIKNIKENAPLLSLEGHTDNVGTDKYNFSLGMRRAGSVKGYLTASDMADKNIEIHSYGENKPIASNKTVEGRKQNRRVEIIEK